MTQSNKDSEYILYFKGAHLMGNYEEGSLNIVTLLISGRATPYLHNGVRNDDNKSINLSNSFP